ncbi:hypothetical protein Zm00014a_008642 [Zea mays]|uniref:Signal peptidase complex subunit 2 n=2 Tax=Zea mays TaxID=4577 RepID=A0A8J8YGR8_MAIZE|nr:putative signal peptidase complex subunit 2 [Zea mays]PWZ19493.1 hypothetical protein Zm00014a_008642 [Zea mays]
MDLDPEGIFRDDSDEDEDSVKGSFSSNGLTVSSKFPRFSDMYTLTIASVNPQSIAANKPIHFTKSVTKWYVPIDL